MRVAFRTDSGNLVGTGHLMRCLTLADGLAERGAAISFVSRDHAGQAASRVTQAGHLLHLLPAPVPADTLPAWTGAPPPIHSAWLGADWPADARETAAALLDNGPLDWLVVDHYAIAAPWEQALRQAHQQRHGKPVRILAIDDLADRAHDCDILLDQNQQQEGRYAHLLPPYCTALLGPRHALVRPEFARLRQQAAAAPSDGVLIYFGTTSLGSLVLDALQAFDHTAPRGLTAHVLAPPGAHVPPALDAAVLKLGKARCRLHLGTDDMAGLMGRCRLAIGAAGTTSWERCTLGLPSVLVSVADNQEPGARALAAAGAAMYLGRAQDVTRATLEHALGALFDQPLLFEGMHSTAAALCDGKGAAQVMAAMEASNISMRRATLHDAPMLHAWRNSEAVRSASFDSRHLPLDEHTGWMQKVLADPMRFLLVAQAHGQDCGCVRFDQNGDSATVSVYLAPDWLHRGIGSAVISAASQWAFDQVPGLRGIDAAIIPTNQASRQAFERAGYQLSRQVYRRNRGDAGLAG